MKNTRGSEWNKWDLHIHTASSYDSPYKADDADELLCQALAENDIKAVAITDHFKIDKTRIEHLRKLAPEIVFFPGVELRTDKGANNLHLIPIIIDQPEDNLDNQSVYNKLVPCICAAKQKRQVIIVTHNPNIAVACDAEQIICCKMDKNTHKITYLSGAIEDQEIKQNVVDILEGTMPAFDLRRRKYV